MRRATLTAALVFGTLALPMFSSPLSSQELEPRQAKPERMVGAWVLTDNDNVPFNLILRTDGTSLTVIGKRHPDLGPPTRMTRNQLLEQGRWSGWGNGIRSDYPDGWIDTIQIGPSGAEQWSWKPGSSLEGVPSNHGKAVRLNTPAMAWVGAYKLQPAQKEKQPYLAVLTSSGLAFNTIDKVADGSWSMLRNGEVLVEWMSGWRTLIQSDHTTLGPVEGLKVKQWGPGVPIDGPPSAIRSGQRL